MHAIFKNLANALAVGEAEAGALRDQRRDEHHQVFEERALHIPRRPDLAVVLCKSEEGVRRSKAGPLKASR